MPPLARTSVAVAAAMSTLAALGCGKARPMVGAPRSCDTWKDDVAPLVATDCVSCHSGASPAGQYDLSSYLGALGNGSSSSPNVVAGDPSSVVLAAINPTTADTIHAPYSGDFTVLDNWVVSCNAAYFNSSIHRGGILNPADPDFHGNLIRGLSWDLGVCTECHGADFSGGTSGVACTTCHAEAGGPTACQTCHGDIAAQGSHGTHIQGGSLQRPLDCSECHVKPSNWTDPGHIVAPDGTVRTSAAIIFGALASAGSNRTGPPTFDPGSKTCTNVYCHGDTFDDTKAKVTKPVWDQPGTGQAACGTCHGIPPSSHASTQCSNCHGSVVDASGKLLNLAAHMNGSVDLGDDTGTCSACHGDATSAAPPRDLLGDTFTSAIGVGAHRSHLEATHRLRGPVPCTDCHLVPSAVGAPGHIDHEMPATVFPVGVSGWTSLATAGGANPTWSHSTATCTGAYCHGGGTTLQTTDKSSNLNRAPIWTQVGGAQAACGTCHGVPPQDGTPGHAAGASLTTCVSCHYRTVDAFGGIIVSGAPGQETSFHINGVIDAP